MSHAKEQNMNNCRLSSKALLIRQLNDRLRTHHIGGRIILTSGVNALGTSVIRAIIKAIAQFTAFDDCNNPYGEHDCAAMEVDCVSILWKIDYYDETLMQHSPDPADHNVTVRILTIMLTDEY